MNSIIRTLVMSIREFVPSPSSFNFIKTFDQIDRLFYVAQLLSTIDPNLTCKVLELLSTFQHRLKKVIIKKMLKKVIEND